MAGWRTPFKRNWIYMIAATILSVMLWVAVSADTINQKFLTADLIIVNSDRRFIQTGLDPARGTIDVLFTGREGAMLALQVARPRVVIRLDSIVSRTVEVDIDPNMVVGRGDRELGDVRAMSVRPSRVRIQFEPRAQKVVPVIPNLVFTFAEGFMLADSVRVQPGVVAIEGPESEVDPIESVRTVPINRQRLSQSLETEVPLEPPTESGLVELSSPAVTVSVVVEPRIQRIFPGIPVGASGVDINSVRVEPSLVDVRLIGPQSAVEAVRPGSLTPRVQISADADYGRSLPIVLLPPALFLQVELEPDSAKVSRLDGAQ